MYITYDRYRGYIVRNNFNHNEIAIFLTREEALMFIQRSSLQQNRQSWQNFNGNSNLIGNNQWQQQQLPYNNPNFWNNQYPQSYEFNPQYSGPTPPNHPYPFPPQLGQNNRINYNDSYGFNPQQHNNNFQQDIYPPNYHNSYGFSPQLPYSNPYPQYDMDFNMNNINMGNVHPNDYSYPTFVTNGPNPPSFLDKKNNRQYNKEVPNNHFVEVDNKPYVSQTEETIAFKKPPIVDEEITYETPKVSKVVEVRQENEINPNKVETPQENKRDFSKIEIPKKEIKQDDENHNLDVKNKQKHLERIDSMIFDEKLIDDNLNNKKTSQLTSEFPNEEILLNDNTKKMDFIHADISTKSENSKKIKNWVWITILIVSIVLLVIIIFVSLYLTNTFGLWDKIKTPPKVPINSDIGQMNHY